MNFDFKHPLTLKEPENQIALAHNEHSIKQIGHSIIKQTNLPWRTVKHNKFLCSDCGKVFTTKEYFDDERIRNLKTSRQSEE